MKLKDKNVQDVNWNTKSHFTLNVHNFTHRGVFFLVAYNASCEVSEEVKSFHFSMCLSTFAILV